MCSNEFLDPPEVPCVKELLNKGDEDVDVWEQVEDPDASGINSNTVLTLKKWLFGDSSESRRLLSDRALLAFSGLLSASGVYLEYSYRIFLQKTGFFCKTQDFSANSSKHAGIF